MGYWNPISTAPKDETRILGWDGKDQFVMYWRGKDHLPHQDKPGWHTNRSVLRVAPTHWKRLDPPPKQAQSGR